MKINPTFNIRTCYIISRYENKFFQARIAWVGLTGIKISSLMQLIKTTYKVCPFNPSNFVNSLKKSILWDLLVFAKSSQTP